MFKACETDLDVKEVGACRERYKCSHFHILVMGRANAGKTTILEKVCGVAKGTEPIIIYDKSGQSYLTKTQSVSLSSKSFR